jgi:hypothetical protein
MSNLYQSYDSMHGYSPGNYSSPNLRTTQPAEKDPLASLRMHGGGLDWPVALRYLTRYDDWKELRERIDAEVERLVQQRAARASATDVADRLDRDVAKLQKHLEFQGEDMPTTRQQTSDARRFLRNVREAIQQAPKSPAGPAY